MGLSAALIAPPIYSGPITSAIAFGSALGMVSLRGNMTKQVADFALVSKSERSKFLAENTGWLIATLIAGGTVFTLIFGSWSVPIRVGLGHAALVLMAISSIMLARTAAAHGIKSGGTEYQLTDRMRQTVFDPLRTSSSINLFVHPIQVIVFNEDDAASSSVDGETPGWNNDRVSVPANDAPLAA